MKSLKRTIAQIVFYTVAGTLLAWTATLTYSFVAAALPQMPWFVPLLSLIVFDLGMLAWMVVFLSYAEGAGQRSVAILACALDLVGVALLVLAEILLGGEQLVTAPAALGEYAIWAIAAWTVANIVAVVCFHLLAPEARKQMALQAEKDHIFDAALEMLTQRRVDSGAQLAEAISADMFARLKAELLAERTAEAGASRPLPVAVPPSPPLRAPQAVDLQPSPNGKDADDAPL